jgi:hypothetical protein
VPICRVDYRLAGFRLRFSISEAKGLVSLIVEATVLIIAQIPPHGRWRHFDVGRSRVNGLIADWAKDSSELEIAKRLIDLFLVSVLLDAGAGSTWSYREKETGEKYTRSEGLAIASLDMFKEGVFSGDAGQPYRVDGAYHFYPLIQYILLLKSSSIMESRGPFAVDGGERIHRHAGGFV